MLTAVNGGGHVGQADSGFYVVRRDFDVDIRSGQMGVCRYTAAIRDFEVLRPRAVESSVYVKWRSSAQSPKEEGSVAFCQGQVTSICPSEIYRERPAAAHKY